MILSKTRKKKQNKSEIVKISVWVYIENSRKNGDHAKVGMLSHIVNNL